MDEVLGFFLTPAGLLAVGTSLAGVVLFASAERLPSVFPSAFARLVGLMAVLAAAATVWALSLGAVSLPWLPPVLLGVPGLAALAIVHLRQTRGRASSAQAPDNR